MRLAIPIARTLAAVVLLAGMASAGLQAAELPEVSVYLNPN
jgi:hypothetical protein